MIRAKRISKNRLEQLDRKSFVSELVERAAEKEGEPVVPETMPVVGSLPTKKVEANSSNESKQSWYLHEVEFLKVMLPLWLIVGVGAIVLALLLLAFWIGSITVKPKYALAYGGPNQTLSGNEMLAGVNEPMPYQYFVSTSPIKSQTEYTAARSMIVLDRTNNSPILTENPGRVMPIASLTKIMTAYVVVNTWGADETFTIAVAVDPDQESSAGLLIGQTYSRDQLLSALLIESAAEAGYTFADSYVGGRTAFIEKMNATAKELGMASTEYVDPVGIGELNVSTSEELAVLTRAFLANETLAEIVGTASKEICSVQGVCVTLSTTNKLLTDVSNFYGVKTGYTVKAGPCLVAWYKKGDSDFIIVLLYVEGRGTDPRFDIAKELSSVANSATMK